MLPHHLLPALLDLAQVLLIDLTLAGDNAVVVGLAVLGLPPRERRLAIGFGIGAAAMLRIALATVALRLLNIIGLTLAGGLLLLWVCWKMFRELRHPPPAAANAAGAAPSSPDALRRAIWRIVLADLSMSLDNVLAVAGAAKNHLWVLVSGLALSVVMMGVAAGLIARLLDRFRWIGWIGLFVVLTVAAELIWKGSHQVLRHAAILPATAS